MQVSCKHLSLASKVFENMFHSQPREVFATIDREPVQIPLQGDDFKSLHILLNIVHGWNRRVPRRVGTNTLLQVLLLADKYEFHEAAEVFTDMWFDAIRPTIPQNLQQDLASWVCICWHLKKPEELNALAKIAIWETSCGLDNPDGSVPDWIIGKISPIQYNVNTILSHADKIQSRRQKILNNFVILLSGLLETYLDPRRRCYRDTNCDALLFGKFSRGLKAAGLYPVPEPSSLNRSIRSLFSDVREIDLDPLCDKYSKRNRGLFLQDESESSVKACHLGEELRSSLSTIEDRFHDFRLNFWGEKDESAQVSFPSEDAEL